MSTSAVNVGAGAAIIYGANASSSGIAVINLDNTNTVWVGTAANINPNDGISIPLGPFGSITMDGTESIYAITTGPIVLVALVPGGTAYTSGTVSISGPTTVEISGPVEVDGAVEISGEPTVQLASGTTVTIDGTANVTIENETIDVTGDVNSTGVGGYVLPGELALLYQNTAAVTAAPSGSTTLGPFNVENYSSIIFAPNGPANSSTATGAAICARFQFQWSDENGNIICYSDTTSMIMSSYTTVQIPVKGSQVSIILFNVGSVGTISFAVDDIYLWGDYRDVQKSTVLGYGINGSPEIVVTGWTIVYPTPPALGVSEWISNLAWVNETASTAYLLILPLFNGSVSGWYGQNTEVLSNDATIVDLTYATQGNINAGASYPNGIIANLPSAETSNQAVSFFAPPTQLAFLFKSSATAGGATFLMLTGMGQ